MTLRVLYIEDNAANARLLERFFALKPAWDLALANDAESGIAMALEAAPDLILMDINLPGLSGVEAARRLRASAATRDVPVVALSADARPEHITAVLAQGFDAYITKPIDFDELERTLMRYDD